MTGMIYENGRGEIKHYDITILDDDGGVHFYAAHDGKRKTFRHDSVLEWLGPMDDPDSHLAYWLDVETEDDDPALTLDLTQTRPSGKGSPHEMARRAEAKRAAKEKAEAAAQPGGLSKLAEAEQRAGTKAEPAPQADGTEATEAPQPKKKRIHWGSFWLGFAVAWGIMITIGTTAQP